MATRVGRCTNDLYCSIASAGQILQMPLDGAFMCPQCGKPLADPLPVRRGLATPALLAFGAMAVCGGALFAAGVLVSGSKAPSAPPTGEARSALGTQQKAPGKIAAAPAVDKKVPEEPVVAPAASADAGTKSAGQAVAAGPAKASMPSVAAISPALSAPSDTKPPPQVITPAAPPRAEVTAERAPQGPQAAMRLAMSQTPSPSQAEIEARTRKAAEGRSQAEVERARAADLARRTEAAQAAADRQKKLQQQALELKRKQALAKQEADAELKTRQEAAAAKAAQDEADRAAREAQVQQAAHAREVAAQAEAARRAAAVPTGPTRGFSAAVVSGGSPTYPSAYEADGRTGRVTVSCLITGSGTPSGCHVVAAQGGVGFSNAAMGWLRSGEVRFRPILRNGQPVSEEHSWSISFEP